MSNPLVSAVAAGFRDLYTSPDVLQQDSEVIVFDFATVDLAAQNLVCNLVG